jgi:glycine/D-amino acid oxidase-like deaminating enzyme
MFERLQERCYWGESAAIPTFNTDRAIPERVDVAIVGGGYTGLSAARELARRGASVAVFEANTFGWGASSRNGGQVLTGAKLSASGLVKRYGQARARDMFAASLQAITYVEQLIASEQIDCDFARCGHIELAYKPGHMNHFAAEAALLGTGFGHDVKLLSHGALAGELGSKSYYGGLLDESSAGLHPGRYVAGLACAAERAGAMLFERAQVLEITPASATQQARVATSRGSLRASEVFVATNGYTDHLVPYLHKRVVPVGSYVIATAPLSEQMIREISPRGRMFYDSKNFLYYWRTTRDNRLIFGGRAEFVPPTAQSTRRSADDLRAGMLYVYPQLANVPIEFAWGGTLGFSFDLLPHAGTTREGLHFALGCGGHGVAMLSHLGACSAWRILGDSVNNPTFELPFPGAPLGLYDGRPWFLPLAGLYYKLRDRLS